MNTEARAWFNTQVSTSSRVAILDKEDHEISGFHDVVFCPPQVSISDAFSYTKTGGILCGDGWCPNIRKELYRFLWGFHRAAHSGVRVIGDLWWLRVCRAEGASNIPIESFSLDWYIQKINGDDPFSFLRYNDGEISTALGTVYETACQMYTSSLGEDLQQSLISYYDEHNYIMGLAPRHHLLGRCWLWESFASFLREHDLMSIRWHGSEVFNKTAAIGKLAPFIRALQETKRLAIVGPPALNNLRKIFADMVFIPIPPFNAHQDIKSICQFVENARPTVVTFSAGPSAVAMIHRLYPKLGDTTTMIDVGSLWMPFAGESYHSSHNRWSIEKNLP